MPFCKKCKVQYHKEHGNNKCYKCKKSNIVYGNVEVSDEEMLQVRELYHFKNKKQKV